MSSAKRSSATQGISKGFFCVPETEKVVGNIFFTIWSDTIKDTIWQ